MRRPLESVEEQEGCSRRQLQPTELIIEWFRASLGTLHVRLPAIRRPCSLRCEQGSELVARLGLIVGPDECAEAGRICRSSRMMAMVARDGCGRVGNATIPNQVLVKASILRDSSRPRYFGCLGVSSEQGSNVASCRYMHEDAAALSHVDQLPRVLRSPRRTHLLSPSSVGRRIMRSDVCVVKMSNC